MNQGLGTILVAVIIASGLVLLLTPQRATQHMAATEAWLAQVRTNPEGAAATELLEKAQAAGAIAWNPTLGRIELRPEIELPVPLDLRLYRRAEEAAALRRDIATATAAQSIIMARVARPDCLAPCSAPTDWQVLAGSQGASLVERMAHAAAEARPVAGLMPPPSTHYPMWRDAGPGFSEWQGWSVVSPVTLILADLTVSRIDISAKLAGPLPPGWNATASWCRDGAPPAVLEPCTLGPESEAFRLERTAAGAPLSIDLAPVALVAAGAPGRRTDLTDRLALDCDAAGVCRAIWHPARVARPYSLLYGGQGDPSAPLPDPVHPTLAGWVVAEDLAADRTILRPSDMAEAMGAAAVIGGTLYPAGGLAGALDGAGALPTETMVQITLDAALQTAAHDLFQSLLSHDRDGPFSGLRFRLPPRGVRASLVVIDLAAGERGAIRAVVGAPAPPSGLSPWDMAAALADPDRGLPPGPAAWTGRGAHQVPGSAWKILTAIALIDAIQDTALPAELRDGLSALMFGATQAEAEAILGEGALSGAGGFCTPRDRTRPPLGVAAGADCPAGYLQVIGDQGAGGPFSRLGPDRFGLTEAITVSSNIWFAALLTHLDAKTPQSAYTVVDGPTDEPAQGVALWRTLTRLGLNTRLALDGGRGTALDTRDPVDIDAFRPDADRRSLATAAFGQQVQAGPLVLAQLAGFVRTGTFFEPGLIGPLPPPQPLFRQSPTASALLDELRHGMEEVVALLRGPGQPLRGTGAEIFALRAGALLDRIGGKTGTADPGTGGDERLSTFTGWIDRPDGQPGFAIGCSVTVMGEQRQGSDSLSVPGLCTHLVAELMARINREDLWAETHGMSPEGGP